MHKIGLQARIIAVFVCAALLASCTAVSFMEKVQEDKRKEYQASQPLPDLEVPPDLILESDELALRLPDREAAPGLEDIEDQSGQEGEATGTAQEGEATGTAQEGEATETTDLGVDALEPGGERSDVAMLGGEPAADDRALKIDAPADKLWPILRQYFESRGRSLEVDDLTLGVMETSWSVPYLSQNDMLRDRVSILVEPGSSDTVTLLAFSSDLQIFNKGEDGAEGTWELTGAATEIEDGIRKELQEFISENI